MNFPILENLTSKDSKKIIDMDMLPEDRNKLLRLKQRVEKEHNRMDELSSVDAGILCGVLLFIDNILGDD